MNMKAMERYNSVSQYSILERNICAIVIDKLRETGKSGSQV